MNQKGLMPILIVILVAAAALGGYWVYSQVNKSSSTSLPDKVACTQDAKLCPDGTYVSRFGPNCEFSPCSEYTVSAEINDWKTYTNTRYGFSFAIPSSWFFSHGTVFSYDHTKITGTAVLGSPSKEEVKFDVYQIPGVEKPTYSASAKRPNYTLISESIISMDGQQGWKQIVQTYVKGGGDVMIISIPYKDRTVKFIIYPANTEYLDTINQILSTFKFN